jgi:glycosyltransferase involved in cell wall biosynthesis
MQTPKTHVPPRLAFLVLNDTYRDSRVLRTADSAAQRGYEVRVFAINSARYRAGLELRSSGAEVVRQRIAGTAMWRAINAGRKLSALRIKDASSQKAKDIPAPPHPEAERVQRPSDRMVAGVTAVAAKCGQMLAGFAKSRLRRKFERLTTQNCARWAPDLVHAHDANTLQIALNLKNSAGVPFVYDAHELWEERSSRVRGSREAKDDRRLTAEGTSCADGVVTVSPGVAACMVDRYGLAEYPTIVRNVPPTWTRGANPGRLKSMAGLPNAAHVVVYVGILGMNRGLEEAIEALPLLPRDVHLVLLGFSEDAAQTWLVRIASDMGVEDRLHLVGSVESNEVPATIADADVSLVTIKSLLLNDHHSLPNKLFESLVAGVPVLASSAPDLAAVVRGYDAGVIIPTIDSRQIAAATSDLLRSADRYKANSLAASQDLSWDSEVQHLLRLYSHILGRTRPSVVNHVE